MLSKNVKFSKIFKKQYSNCDGKLKSKFKSLNLRSKGCMYWQLSRQTKIKTVHYILDENGQLAAWALTFSTNNNNVSHLHTYFYTRVIYRKCGLGYKLSKAVLKYANTLGKEVMFYERAKRFLEKNIF